MPDGSPWPRISIITPSFNQAPFIEETMRSVLLQGYPNLEYFVIDGGSSDGSVELIRRYAPWLTYWVSERDEGQNDAINKGWQRATGQMLAWLNSDDLYEPSALYHVAAAHAAHPTAGLLHGLCLEFDATGMTRMIGGPYDMLTAITISFDKGGNVAQPAAFVTRQVMDRVGRLDTRLKQSMDKDLWQRTAALSEVVFLPQVLARFRVHFEQLSQQRARDPNFFIGYERLMALKNLFSMSGLPTPVLRARRRALAKVHLDFALALRFAGAPMPAFRHLFYSFANPMNAVWTRRDLRTLILTLAGPRMAALISGVKRSYTFARRTVGVTIQTLKKRRYGKSIGCEIILTLLAAPWPT